MAGTPARESAIFAGPTVPAGATNASCDDERHVTGTTTPPTVKRQPSDGNAVALAPKAGDAEVMVAAVPLPALAHAVGDTATETGSAVGANPASVHASITPL